MRKRGKRTAALCLAVLMLTLNVSACGKNEETDGSERKTIENDTKKEEMVERTVAGVTLKLPSDMGEFENSDGINNIAALPDKSAGVTVSELLDGEGSVAADYNEETIQTVLFEEYTDIEFAEFEVSIPIDDTTTFNYAHCTMKNKQDVELEAYVYIIFYGSGQIQIIWAYYAPEYHTSLEKNIEEFNDSLEVETVSGGNAEGEGQIDSEYGIATGYFVLQVPQSWGEKIQYVENKREGGGYSFDIVETSSYAAGVGGKLFTVCLLPQDYDYTVFPDYDYLGTLGIIDNQTYNVVIMYPTDVQFLPETEQAYQSMKADVPDVIATFAANEGYSFTR